jgi:regulator of cell morphogenesis and NO signaling
MEKVFQAHSPRHPEFKSLKIVFKNLRAELEPHLLKEERVLFSLIVKLECNALGLQMQAATGPIWVTRHEHDEAEKLLKQMRILSKGYVAPKTATSSFNFCMMS